MPTPYPYSEITLSDSPDWSIEIQVSGAYTYIGYAAPGTLLATAAWKAKRVTTASGVTLWANGNNNFVNVATDLTALSYS